MSRMSDDNASRRRASSSRSPARPVERLRAVEAPARIGRVRRSPWSSRAGDVARLRRVLGAAFQRASDAAVRSRGRGMRVGRAESVFLHEQHVGHVGRRRADRSAAAGSANARSAAARRAGSVISTNTDAGGGSSSVLSSAFCASGISASASSMMTSAAASFERTIAGAIDRLAHLIDLDGARVARLDDEDVGVDAARDAAAGGALAARVLFVNRRRGLDRPLAVERLRERVGGQALADAVRAGEDQAGRQRPARHRARQQVENRPMPRDRAEGHNPANVSRAAAASGLLRVLRILRVLRLLRILLPEQLAPEAALLRPVSAAHSRPSHRWARAPVPRFRSCPAAPAAQPD